MAIETATEINTEVATIIQDSTFSITDTIFYINKALKEISGAIKPYQILLPKLLETDTTVNTVNSTAYLSLPADFQKNLHYCYSNTNNRKIKIYGSLELLYSAFSRLDLGGVVVGVARRGDRLYYQHIPASAETLRVHYYRYPTVQTIGADQNDALPEFLTRPLLVNYVAKEIFKLIEDGIDGNKPNTEYYTHEYSTAMTALYRHIGPEGRCPVDIHDNVNLESYL
jgi:hypothetical protein